MNFLKVLFSLLPITICYLLPATAWTSIGKTTQELEAEKGEASMTRKINNHIVFLFYLFPKTEEVLIMIDGKSALHTQKKPNEEDFTETEITSFLERNKGPEKANWVLLEQEAVPSARIYKLQDKSGVLAIWKDRKVMICTPQGIKALNENKEIFYKFIDQLKGEIDILKQENAIQARENEQQSYEIQIVEKGTRNPKEAVLFSLERKNAGFDIEFPFYFASEWHRKNPKDYMAWARTLKKEEYDLALQCTYDTTQNEGTQEADEYVQEVMARGPKRNQALGVIAYKKAVHNPETAAEWASQLELDDEARIDALNMVALIWAATEPEKTIEWIVDISDTLPSELTGNSTSVSAFFTLTKLFERNPKLAFRKATELKNPDVRNPQVFRIAGLWARKTPEDLKKEITKLNDKEKIKPALMGLVEGLSKQNDPNFSAIADWLLRLEPFPQPGPAPCGDYFSILIAQWIKTDGEGCLRWVKQALEKRATELQRTAILGHLESLRDTLR